MLFLSQLFPSFPACRFLILYRCEWGQRLLGQTRRMVWGGGGSGARGEKLPPVWAPPMPSWVNPNLPFPPNMLLFRVLKPQRRRRSYLDSEVAGWASQLYFCLCAIEQLVMNYSIICVRSRPFLSPSRAGFLGFFPAVWLVKASFTLLSFLFLSSRACVHDLTPPPSSPRVIIMHYTDSMLGK